MCFDGRTGCDVCVCVCVCVCVLCVQEIAQLLELEETSLSSDLSQGYALKMLTCKSPLLSPSATDSLSLSTPPRPPTPPLSPALLQSFLSVERIKQHFKGRLVGMVLDGYLSLRRYICITHC